MLRLKQQWETSEDKPYDAKVRKFESQLHELAIGNYEEPNSKRIAKRLLKYESELTAFLHEKDLDATNNAAERALRPAVVMRKIGSVNGGRTVNSYAWGSGRWFLSPNQQIEDSLDPPGEFGHKFDFRKVGLSKID